MLPGALEEWCISTSLPPLPLSLAVRSVDVSLLLSWEPFIKLFCKTYKVQIYLQPFHALIKACCNQGLDKNIPQLYFCFYAFYQTDLQNVSSIKQIYISHIWCNLNLVKKNFLLLKTSNLLTRQKTSNMQRFAENFQVPSRTNYPYK